MISMAPDFTLMMHSFAEQSHKPYIKQNTHAEQNDKKDEIPTLTLKVVFKKQT